MRTPGSQLLGDGSASSIVQVLISTKENPQKHRSEMNGDRHFQGLTRCNLKSLERR
jgi:hypothetical protein